MYTSEKNGSDETGDGTPEKPLKTILQAMKQAGKEPFPCIYVDSKEEGKVCYAALNVTFEYSWCEYLYLN